MMKKLIKSTSFKRINKLFIGLIIIIFSAVAVFGLSLITGNQDQTNIGSSNASSTEPADINNDNKVDVFDLSILLSKWGTNNTTSDLNKDGTTNVFDLSILLSKWGVVVDSEPAIWVGDYETGNLSQFAPGSWNFYPSGASATTVASNSVVPAGKGSYIGKYYVPSGSLSTNGTVRAENIIDSKYNFSNGMDRWFSFSTYLGNDVPNATSDWQVLAQWKNDSEGSPPIELIINNGVFKIDGGYGYPGSNSPSPRHYQQQVATATKGMWHDWLFHIYFSDNPNEGYIEAWHNGQVVSWNPYVQAGYPKVVSGTKFYPPGGTLFPGLSSYLKIGIYRSANITQPSTYYHDNWQIGFTRASVE